MKAYTSFSTRTQTQREPNPFGTDVRNNAGGYVYQLDSFKQLERFLILGSEGGTFYVGERKLTKQNALNTIAAIKADGVKAVDLIVDVSTKGRAAKNDPAIFALALAASAPDPKTRSYALSKLGSVCRIPTHLFHFAAYVEQFRGWGRGLKRAVGNWYQDKPVDNLAYQMVKFQSRDGWSNADLLRLAHPKTDDPSRNALYKWVVDGDKEVDKGQLPEIVNAFELLKGVNPTEAKSFLGYIEKYNLSREMLPTEWLKLPEVWAAMLPRMPLEAMIRNLGNMSKIGLLTPLSEASKIVVSKLADREALKRARIHPYGVLVALKVYQSGAGLRGSGEWKPVPAVVDALNEAFYACFDYLEPTGKSILLGVDVSGSMSSAFIGQDRLISAAEAAAVMAMACARMEQNYYIMGFTSGSSGYYGSRHYGQSHLDGFVDLGITAKMSLNEALAKTRGLNFGATDCALPMLWAIQNNAKVDAFVVLTDNETWAGNVKPVEALRQYRQKSGINAKEIVVGMTATQFTIADPTDANALDVVGFDAAVPAVISEFIRG